MNVPKEQQARVIRALRQSLNDAGCASTIIGTSDENNVYAAITTHQYLQSINVSSLVGRVNVHGYVGLQPLRDNAVRARLRNLVGENYPVWQTEYGDNDQTGMTTVQQILEDVEREQDVKIRNR
jgi:hypothetical protein